MSTKKKKPDLLEEVNGSRASGGECWVAGAFKADDLRLACVHVCLPGACPVPLLGSRTVLSTCPGVQVGWRCLPSHLTEGKVEAVCLQLKVLRGHQQASCWCRSLGPICDLAPRARCPSFAVPVVNWWATGRPLFCGDRGCSRAHLPFRVSAGAWVGGEAWSQKVTFLPASQTGLKGCWDD